MRYYIQIQGQVAGPYSLEEIQQRTQRGELSVNTPVCPEGANVWGPLPGLGGAPVVPPPIVQSGPVPAGAPFVPPPPPKKKGGGCCGCLLTGFIVLVVLVVAAIATGWYVFFKTPVPFRWVADNILAKENVMVKGINGSISSGITVESIEWKAPDGQMNEVDDVRFTYTGVSSGGRYLAEIKDINVGKAHIVADFSSGATSSSSLGSSSSSRSSSTTTNTNNLDFRIDRIHFGDVYIKDTHSGVEFTMPSFDYNGFEIKNGQVEFGTLQLNSDRLDIQTKPGVTAKVDGEQMQYQKRFEGTIKPLLYKAIKKPITFALDVGMTPKYEFYFRLLAFDQKLSVAGAKEHSHLTASNLPLDSYLSLAPYDTPSKVNLDSNTTTPAEGPATHSAKGNFTLGGTKFVLDPLPPDPAQGEPAPDRTEYTATGRVGDDQVVAVLTTHGDNAAPTATFRSAPEMKPEDLLGKIFFGKEYSELAEDQQKQIDAKVKVYFQEAKKDE